MPDRTSLLLSTKTLSHRCPCDAGQDGLHGGKTHSQEQQRVKLLPEKPGEGKPENIHSADRLRRMDSQNADNRDCRGNRQGKEQEQQGASQEKGGNVNGQHPAGETGKPCGEQKPQPQADQQDSRQFADHSADDPGTDQPNALHTARSRRRVITQKFAAVIQFTMENR